MPAPHLSPDSNSNAPRRSRRRLSALAAHVTWAVALSLGQAGQVHAQSAAQTIQYDVPPGRLADALNRFAQQAGVAIAVDANRLRGLNSPGLKGSYGIEEGFGILLRGSGYAVDRTADGYVLRAAPAATSAAGREGAAVLPTVKVQDDDENAQTAGRLNPPTTVGSKTPLAQRELPQSVTVIPQEQIQQQAMKTLNDAMRYAPGVEIAQDDSERTTFYARGFPLSSWLLDGIPTVQNLTSVAPNLAMFDRVEVLRGPDGFLNGFGGEGGAVNLVRKRAPDAFSLTAELYGGNYADVGGMIDAGGPLNGSGTLRGRIVGALQSQDLMWDTTWRRDKLIYGTLEADLGPDTKLRFGGSFSELDQKAQWVGVPVYFDADDSRYLPVDIARSDYIGAPWNDNTYYNETAFAELDQQFGQGWSGRVAFNYLGSRSSILNGQKEAVDPVSDQATLADTRWNQADDQESVDVLASGPVQLFGRTHTLTVGASYQHENLRVINHYCGSGDSSSGDIWCDSAGSLSGADFPLPSFDGPVSDETTVNDQYGIYGNARISVADPLTLVLGARGTWWSSRFNPVADANYWQDPVRHSDISGKFTPYGGLIYDLDSHHSLYASYTSIFNPQSVYDEEGRILPPLEGEQYEVGAKGEYFDGALNTALALFQLTEKNRAMDDPRFPAGSGIEVAQGRARSKGVELTATGQLAPGWTLFGGYTYTSVRYLDASSNPTGIGFTSIAPKHLFKLWTNYQLPGVLQPFSVGGGIYMASGIWADDGQGGVLRVGGVATFDLRAGYQISQRFSAALNVSNLFDRRYFSSIENTGDVFYGNPRKILVTVRYQL